MTDVTTRRYIADASFNYEMYESEIQYTLIELEYKPWDNLTEGETLNCYDEESLNISTTNLIKTLTWNMRRGEDLVTVDRGRSFNLSECDDETEEYTWDKTIEIGEIDMLRVILFDNGGDETPSDYVQVEYRVLPNGSWVVIISYRIFQTPADVEAR